MVQCFICSNLNLRSEVFNRCYGFPLCRNHIAVINHQEEKAERAGNPAWKEVWDDIGTHDASDVEAAINYLIVLKGSLQNLSSEVYIAIDKYDLKKKYSSYMGKPGINP